MFLTSQQVEDMQHEQTYLFGGGSSFTPFLQNNNFTLFLCHSESRFNRSEESR